MEETLTTEQKEVVKQNGDLDKMMEAGLHFGHKTSKTHPQMKPYIASVRNTIHLINLEKTKEKLEVALATVRDLVAAGKIILLVGTKVQVKDSVRKLAEETGLPHVTERWIGGLLTNYESVSKRIGYLKDLEEKKKSGELEKYTKKEQLRLEEKRKKLEEKFGGVKNLERLPDAVFIFDLDANGIALREAKVKKIQVLAISDTDCDPTSVDFAIPANNDSRSAIQYVAEKLGEAIKQAKPQ